MNYRITELLAKESYTADTTKVIDIKLVDIISFLTVEFGSVCADNVNDNTPLDAITKCELVDGSDVLFSLDGVQAEALDWYQRGGKILTPWNMFLTGNTCQRAFTIMFGRDQWDPLFALDPTRFKNLQLRITLDISEGGNSPATVYLTVNAGVFDGKVITPQGFFTTKELKQWTMADSTHEYTDLPLDYPYRAIYLRALLAGTEPVQCVANIKISEDQDKRVPFDIDQSALARQIQGNYPLVEEIAYTVCQTSQTTLYCMPTTGVVASVLSWAAAAAELNVGAYDGDGGQLHIDAATASGNVQVIIKGSIPHAVIELPCGRKDDPNDWYDVRNLGNLRADIEGDAAAQGYLFIQQVRGY